MGVPSPRDRGTPEVRMRTVISASGVRWSMYTDPLKGRNPFAVARLVRSGSAPCPVCGDRAVIEASVKDDEVVAEIRCTRCNFGGPVAVSVTDDGDVHLECNGREYLSTFEENSADGSAGSIISAAEAAVRAGRPGKAIRMLSDAAGKARDGPADVCIDLAVEAAETMSGQGAHTDAIAFLESYLELADSADVSSRADLHSSLALAHLENGDPQASIRDLREVIQGLKDPLPESDPLVRARVNETLGIILEAKPDYAGAMKCFNSAIKDCNKVLDTSGDALVMLSRVSVEYAESAFHAQQQKKGTEAVKLAVRACRDRKDSNPGAYAEALLQRARYLNIVDAVDPGLKESMDEAIEILKEPDESGMYDRLLPLAYYYRSASSGRKDVLDIEDLANAYEILRDNLVSGKLPGGTMYAVSETYVQYLDLFDQERSRQVRSELAGLGFVFPPPPELKKEDEPGQSGPE